MVFFTLCGVGKNGDSCYSMARFFHEFFKRESILFIGSKNVITPITDRESAGFYVCH